MHLLHNDTMKLNETMLMHSLFALTFVPCLYVPFVYSER